MVKHLKDSQNVEYAKELDIAIEIQKKLLDSSFLQELLNIYPPAVSLRIKKHLKNLFHSPLEKLASF